VRLVKPKLVWTLCLTYKMPEARGLSGKGLGRDGMTSRITSDMEQDRAAWGSDHQRRTRMPGACCMEGSFTGAFGRSSQFRRASWASAKTSPDLHPNRVLAEWAVGGRAAPRRIIRLAMRGLRQQVGLQGLPE